jgi:Peptidase_C39 like family
MTSPSEIAAAASIPAPLVPDHGPSSKAGIPAPPMTPSMRAANDARQAKARQAVRLAARGMGPDAACSKQPCAGGMPAARELAGTQEPQRRGYWCGPATVSEMLAQMGKRVSQSAAARELGTTGDGTDWSNGSGYPVPDVLNRNQSRNDYVAVALPWAPTVWQVRRYERDLVTDINHGAGVPLAGNAYEVPGGPHLAGHPLDQTIMHWFDIRGYADNGAVTDYEDSVHGAAPIGWALNVPAYSSMRSSTIVEILGARGYDW